MAEHTTVKLAKALREIPGMPPDMISRAIDGYYHDYLSPLTFPEMQLVTDLRRLAAEPTTGPKAKAALTAMTQRVIDGEFDATKEESDEWARSPEGQETFQQLTADSVFSGMVKKMRSEGKT
jgi:hypothetical protein